MSNELYSPPDTPRMSNDLLSKIDSSLIASQSTFIGGDGSHQHKFSAESADMKPRETEERSRIQDLQEQLNKIKLGVDKKSSSIASSSPTTTRTESGSVSKTSGFMRREKSEVYSAHTGLERTSGSEILSAEESNPLVWEGATAALHDEKARKSDSNSAEAAILESSTLRNTSYSYQPSIGSPVSSTGLSPSLLIVPEYVDTNFLLNKNKSALQAVTALQTKIRNLEADNLHLKNQCEQLQQQLKSVREQYLNQNELSSKRLSEMENACDAKYKNLQDQKNQLQMKLIKKEEEVQSSERSFLILQSEKVASEMDVKLAGEREIHMRNRIDVLEDELKRSQLREKELEKNISTVDEAKASLTTAANLATEDFESELKRERESRHRAEMKRLKAEEFLQDVVKINKQLVEKLAKASGEEMRGLTNRDDTTNGMKQSPTTLKKKSKKKVHFADMLLPGAEKSEATKVTATSDLSASYHDSINRSTASTRARKAPVSTATTSIPPRRRSKDVVKRRRKLKKKRQKNLHKKLQEANGGPVPFILSSNSTGKSFSLISNTQTRLAPSEAYGSASEQGGPTTTRSRSGHCKGISVDATSSKIATNIEHFGTPVLNKIKKTQKVNISLPAPGYVFSDEDDPGLRNVEVSTLHEMNSVINSLQDEHDDLNNRYQSLISSARDATSDRHQIDDKKLSDALRHMIAQMERKGAQLSLLKRFHDSMKHLKERIPVKSPAAAKEKTDALRVLKNFRVSNSPPRVRRR